ncbi:MAG TPA: transglutaminase family protein [Chthoniobacterales bacterium]
MSRLRILHTTTYNYAEPVEFGPHRLVLRPREGHDLQVESLDLRIEPPATVTWQRDVFGNSIAFAHFSDPSERLEFQNEVTIFRRDPDSSAAPAGSLAARLPLEYSPFEEPVVRGYLAPVYPEESALLQQWAGGQFTAGDGDEAMSLLGEIGEWIRQHIQYRRREDRGVQSPLETLRLRSGSCRDMATLLLETLRSLRLPARFASGYLDSAASAAGRAATHAWTEVYFPQYGWRGYDPTLGEPTSHKHIVTGVSSHPRGVMPVSGSYHGPSGITLGMAVSVKIDRLSAIVLS